MRFTARAILLFLCVTFLSIEALGKEWRGIVPLKSTRADVKRILGTPIKEWDWGSYFTLTEGIVLVEYQTGNCNEDLGLLGYGWKVPEGTVTSIGLIPRKKLKKDVLLKGETFQPSPFGGGIIYYDAASGLSLETYRDAVTLIEYRAQKSQEPLGCPQVRNCCADFFAKFDAYGDLPFADEKARLDNFHIQMTNALRRGVMIVYGETSAVRRTWLKRADRAKNYLITKLGLDPPRLLIVDGGYRESAYIELFLYGIGGQGPRISVDIQKEPARTSRDKQ